MTFQLYLILAIFLSCHGTDQALNDDDDSGVLIYKDLGVIFEPVSYEESVGFYENADVTVVQIGIKRERAQIPGIIQKREDLRTTAIQPEYTDTASNNEAKACYERWALTVNMWGKRYSVLESAAEKLFLRQTKQNYKLTGARKKRDVLSSATRVFSKLSEKLGSTVGLGKGAKRNVTKWFATEVPKIGLSITNSLVLGAEAERAALVAMEMDKQLEALENCSGDLEMFSLLQGLKHEDYAQKIKSMMAWIEAQSSTLPSLISEEDLTSIVGLAKNFGPVIEENPELLRQYSETRLMKFVVTNGSYHFHFAVSFPLLKPQNVYTVHRVRQTGFFNNGQFVTLELPKKVVIVQGVPWSYNCDISWGKLCKVERNHLIHLPCFSPPGVCVTHNVTQTSNRFINLLNMCFIATSGKVEVIPREKTSSATFLAVEKRGVYSVNWTTFSSIIVHRYDNGPTLVIMAPDLTDSDSDTVWIRQDNFTLPQLRDKFYLQDIYVYARQYSETMGIVRKTFGVIQSISTNVVMNEGNRKGMNIFSIINSLWKFGGFIFMLIVGTIVVGIPATVLYKLWTLIYTEYRSRKRTNNPNRQRPVYI